MVPLERPPTVIPPAPFNILISTSRDHVARKCVCCCGREVLSDKWGGKKA
jgi:hypothetical protein